MSMADEKKYPWIKSIFHRKKKDEARGVYAGPEQMSFQRIYDGPKPPDLSALPERPIEMPVYAGPEFFKGEAIPMKMVYAAPEVSDREKPEAEMEEVYAGPGMMEELPEGTVRCGACGEPIPENAAFCPECGMPHREKKHD